MSGMTGMKQFKCVCQFSHRCSKTKEKLLILFQELSKLNTLLKLGLQIESPYQYNQIQQFKIFNINFFESIFKSFQNQPNLKLKNLSLDLNG